MSGGGREEPVRGKIWDAPTRLFHWALACAVATSMISVNVDEMEIHILSGSVVFALLMFRILWGIWGASTAQFHRFFPAPGDLIAYLKGRWLARPGHTPVGALSVFAMLGALMAQVGTGLVADDEIYVTGPLRNFVGAAQASSATSAHGVIDDVILILIGLHISAILIYRIRGKRLTRAMITGEGQGAGPAVVFRPVWLSLATMAVSAGAAYYVFNI